MSPAQIVYLQGYRGIMVRDHIYAILKHCQNWHVEAIMSTTNRPPTLRSHVCIKRADKDLLHGFSALTLTNPIASTLRSHFQTQDDRHLRAFQTAMNHISSLPHYNIINHNTISNPTPRAFLYSTASHPYENTAKHGKHGS
jgi:hypothetical protein